MTTRVYLNDADQAGGWALVDLPARRGTDSMRVWLSQHLKVHVLGPLPASEVPQQLHPLGGRWSAICGRTSTDGYVVVITDDDHHVRSGVRS